MSKDAKIPTTYLNKKTTRPQSVLNWANIEDYTVEELKEFLKDFKCATGNKNKSQLKETLNNCLKKQIEPLISKFLSLQKTYQNNHLRIFTIEELKNICRYYDYFQINKCIGKNYCPIHQYMDCTTQIIEQIDLLSKVSKEKDETTKTECVKILNKEANSQFTYPKYYKNQIREEKHILKKEHKIDNSFDVDPKTLDTIELFKLPPKVLKKICQDNNLPFYFQDQNDLVNLILNFVIKDYPYRRGGNYTPDRIKSVNKNELELFNVEELKEICKEHELKSGTLLKNELIEMILEHFKTCFC